MSHNSLLPRGPPRPACLHSLVNKPDPRETPPVSDMFGLLRVERQVNDKMRQFLSRLDDLCVEAGKPDDVRGEEVLTWLRDQLIGS